MDGNEKEKSLCPISPSSESEEQLHPMLRLQRRACNLANVEFDRACAIDTVNLARGLGEAVITILVETFHKKVYSCEDDWFREMFTSDINDSSGDLAEFLIQRLGGRNYYTERKGHPNLIGRHCNFELTPRTAEKWLDLMQEAMEEMEEDINEKTRDRLMDYFRYTAYFLVASQDGACLMSQMGTFDHVKESLADEAEEKL